jgi:hypothetical protein
MKNPPKLQILIGVIAMIALIIQFITSSKDDR